MKTLTSIRMPKLTEDQIATLKAKTGLGQSEIITTAIDRMYREEITMSYKIGKIDTTPQLDPYHADTGTPTYTELYIDPERRLVMLTQEADDNAIPMDEWHGVVLSARLRVHPEESEARTVLTDNPLIEIIIDGHSVEWDGSNHVGRMTDEASKALDELVDQLNDCVETTVNLWSAWDWFAQSSDNDLGITVETSDEEIATIATKLEEEARSDDAIIHDDIACYLRYRRDKIQSEFID